jgi:predicted TIM-barrel fold metal-dependent hydrolase
MRHLPLVALIGAGVCACGSRDRAAAPPEPARYLKVDVHTHFGPGAAARVVSLMDAHGIDVVVNLSGGSPGRGLEEQLAAAAAFEGRIVVFTTPDWRLTRTGAGYGERLAAQLRAAHTLGAAGLKISKGLGLGFADAAGALIAVDDPALDPLFETAGELGMPVAIHTGDPVAFWRPPTRDNERFAELSVHPEWSFYGAGLPSWEELFAAYERRVARHPNTTFIGVHFGNAPEDPRRVAAMLGRYDNLYIDTAARIPEIGRHDADDMRVLLTTHADRILFGTDLGVGRRPGDVMLGSTGATPPDASDIDHFYASTWRYFETADRAFAHPTPIQGDWTIDGVNLGRAALARIYGTNAQTLLGLDRDLAP